MALKPPMMGFLCRNSYGSIPSSPNFRTTTSGINGVVSQIIWGQLMAATPAAYPNFTDGIGSAHFATDLNAMETSSSGGGAMDDIIADMTNVEQNLAPGAGVKLRMFSGVQSTPATQLNPPSPPPMPAWLADPSYCGIFVVRNQQSGPPDYWVNGTALTSGTKVLSPTDGRFYTTTGVTTTQNTVDPGSAGAGAAVNSHWGAGLYGPYAGPVVRWFGTAAPKYLAAYSYFELLLANCRVWIDCQNYVNAGDSQTLGHGTGTWHVALAGATGDGRPSGKDNSNSTAFTLDTCPIIQEITHSACCSIYGEICNREIAQGDHPTGSPLNASNLAAVRAAYLNAGYTTYSGLQAGHTVWSSGHDGGGVPGSPAPDSDVGQIVACQHATAIAWPNTCISEAHNPFQRHPADATGGNDEPTTQYLINQLVNGCAQGQAVPGNNSLQDPLVQLDRDVAAAGGPIYFQTASMNVLGSTTIQTVITNGLGITYPNLTHPVGSAGAWNIELPTGFENDVTTTAALLALWNTWKGYITLGTGPSGHTDAFAPANVRAPGTTAPAITNYASMPATGTVGTAYSFTFTATNGPISAWNVVGGASNLPPGLTLNNSGVLAGTPTAGSATPYNFAINCTNTSGLSSTNVSLTITVPTVSGGPVITAEDPPDTILGTLYNPPSGYTFQAGGGGGLPALDGLLNIKTTGTGFTNATWRNATCGYVPSDNGSGGQPTGTIYLSALFPSGPTLASSNAIDQALTEVAAWNAVTGHTQQRLKIRISPGIHSPTWLKSSTYGGTFSMIDPTGDVSGTQTCPNFWTKLFQDEFYALMQILATAYDSNPLIAELVSTPNATFYPEACLRQNASSGAGVPTGGNPNMTNMIQAGYRMGDAATAYTDVWNQNRVATLLTAMWPNTIVGVTFNPYQKVDITNPLTTTTAMTNGTTSPTSFTGFTLPTGCAITSGDNIMVRDAQGNSQIFVASANKAVGATNIAVTAQTVTLVSQSSYQIYSVQQGGSATTLTWPIVNDASDPATTGTIITASALPNVSLENDSARHNQIGATGDYNTMFAAMNAAAAAASGVTVGVQTAQGPNIDGGTPITTAHMADLMTALATGSSDSMPIATHVELFPPWSSNPDWTGGFSSAAAASLAAAALPMPTSSTAFTWAIADPTDNPPPPGLTLNSSTGVLSGTTTGGPGTYTFQVTVTDPSSRVTVSDPITMTVTSTTTTTGAVQTAFGLINVSGTWRWAQALTP